MANSSLEISFSKKVLSIFDVTPTRPIAYTSLGYANSPYYSEELNIQFLQDIKEIFEENNWKICWKSKRVSERHFASRSFIKKNFQLIIMFVILTKLSE